LFNIPYNFIFLIKPKELLSKIKVESLKVETKFHKFLYLFNKSKDINPLFNDYNIPYNFIFFNKTQGTFVQNQKWNH